MRAGLRKEIAVLLANGPAGYANVMHTPMLSRRRAGAATYGDATVMVALVATFWGANRRML